MHRVYCFHSSIEDVFCLILGAHSFLDEQRKPPQPWLSSIHTFQGNRESNYYRIRPRNVLIPKGVIAAVPVSASDSSNAWVLPAWRPHARPLLPNTKRVIAMNDDELKRRIRS